MISLSKYINLRCLVFPIYICDDSVIELKRFKKIITEIITGEGFTEMFVALATPDPLEILGKFDNNIIPALYFLDIDLGQGVIDGIELASRIRKHNAKAVIVMITGYNFALETYKMQIGVKDYILKGDIKEMSQRIKACLIDARLPLTEPDDADRTFLTIHSNYTKIAVDVSEIYYIEVVIGTQRKLNIHKRNSVMSASATLKEVIGQASDTIFQCHKSYMLNINHVVSIDTKKRMVVMDNGAIVPVSLMNIKKIKRELEAISNK
jgi:two-component system response regulator AgrA